MKLVSLLCRIVFWLVLAGGLAFLIVPAVLVVALSFSNDAGIAFPPTVWGVDQYRKLAAGGPWWDGLVLSFEIGILVAVLSAAVAVPAVLALARTGLARIRGLDLLGILPLLVPQSAFAIGMYLVMVQLGLVGSMGGLVVAVVAVSFPMVFVTVRAGMAHVPQDLELVAMTLGAARWRAWLGITLRLLLPVVLTGFLFAFLTSFDEAVFATFLTGPGLVTLPKAIFDSVRLGVDPVITAIATLLMGFTALLFLTAFGLRQWTARQKAQP
jgi:ABC-type spermidine/putrescine transport system permease subunit II